VITETRPTSAPKPPDSNGGRAAWIALGSIFAVATLVYGVFSIVQLLAYAKTSTRTAFVEDVRSIDVRNGAGKTRIVATEDDEVVVEASITYGLQKPDNDARVEGDQLVVRSSCPTFSQWCNVSYTVYVPADVDVFVRGSGGGVSVEGITGSIDASSSGGGVRVADASGALRLRSSGGGITGERLRSQTVDASSSGGGVRLAFTAAPRDVDAHSSGGGVTVVVPETPDGYNVQASSSGGSVRTSEVRHDPASDRRIEVSSSGGGVTVRPPGE
jgi:hypothetical protein